MALSESEEIHTVRDNLSISRDEVKTYLRIASDQTEDDAWIDDAIVAAKEAADAICQNENWTSASKIPKQVKLWCLKYIAYNYERRDLQRRRVALTGLASSEWDFEVPDDRDLLPYRSNPGL
jgi:hypothetical protein